jgi:hypothetical protein
MSGLLDACRFPERRRTFVGNPCADFGKTSFYQCDVFVQRLDASNSGDCLSDMGVGSELPKAAGESPNVIGTGQM